MSKQKLSNLEIIKKWKRTERNLQVAISDPEIVGTPDYENLPDNVVPLKFHPATDVNSLGSWSAQKIASYIDQRNIDKQNDRFKRYEQITEALNSPEVTAAVNIYADEICTEDQEGNIIHIISDDQEIIDVGKKLFERLGFTGNSNNLWYISKNMCAFGDEFSEIIFSRDNESIIGLNHIPRNLIERVEENGILKGFKPIEIEGESTPNSFVYYKVNQKEIDDQEKKLIHPFRIIHWRIATSMSSSKYGIYGESIVDPILGTSEKINLLEKAMLIAQVTRAPERRVFFIDVGNLPGNKAIQYAHDVVNSLKKKKVIDIFNNKKPAAQTDVFGATEDIAIPKRTGAEGNRIETLPQPATFDIAPIEFIKNRLFNGLRIPETYMFDNTYANTNTNFSSKSIPFAKTIRRLQRFILIQLTKLLKVELRLKGFDAERINNFILAMNNPSNLDEAQKIELATNKWNLITSIRGQNNETGVFYPDFLIYKDILKMSDEEIVEIIRLNQLQMMGENIFNIYEEADRPQDSDKILNKNELNKKMSGEPLAGENASIGDMGMAMDSGGELPPEEPVANEALPEEAPEEETPAPETASYNPDTIKKTIINEKKEMAMEFRKRLLKLYSENEILNQETKRVKENTKYSNGVYLELSGELEGIDELLSKKIELIQEGK